ncbi:hypothetical protein H4R19_006686, partial [Coemansia spiralis]
MVSRVASALAGAVVLAQLGACALSGSGIITYHDYQSLPLSAMMNNPPACGMSYAQLDMTRITAVQALDKSSDCGRCMKVGNAHDDTKFVYVLAVDLGGRGLDLSKPSFGKLFPLDDGVGPATWTPVDASLCHGIWSNGEPAPPPQAPAPPPPPPPPPPPVPSPQPQVPYPPPAPVTLTVVPPPSPPPAVPVSSTKPDASLPGRLDVSPYPNASSKDQSDQMSSGVLSSFGSRISLNSSNNR